MNILTVQITDNEMARHALTRALRATGGGAALTRKLAEKNVILTRQAVNLWVRVPLKYVRVVSEITGIPAIEFVPEVT